MSNLINPTHSTPPEAFDPKHGLFVVADQKPIPLLGIRATGALQGLLVDWKVAQRYRNVEKKPIEAIYAFPMPEDSTVYSLRIRVGDKVLVGKVEEREAAFEKYDEAMAAGNGAFLLDQEEPNHFLMSVGNLLPGQEVEVEIGFLVPAAFHEKGVRVALPTTISPRYSSATQTAEERAEIERITPPYADAVPYGLSLNLQAEFASPVRVVESPSHPIRSEISGNHSVVSLSQGEVALDRDVVFLFETAEPHTASAWTSTAFGHGHVVAQLIPDLGAENSDQPRSVTFLLDCSGSMAGDSIDQARRAVELCLRSLNEGDRFQIVRFGSTYESLFPEPQKFSQATLDAAIERVRKIDANLGGTEILEALQSLFSKAAGAKEQGMLDLVLMTDGEVSFADQVLAWARENRERCRIFSFGIGAGASDHLVTGVARESRGAAEFIFPGERIETKVLRQFTRLRTPMLSEIEVDWGDVQVTTAPIEIPPVFDKDPLLISARLAAGKALPAEASVRLSGVVAGKRLSWEAKARPVSNGEMIARWWARLLIRDLDKGFEVPKRGSNQKRGQAKSSAGLDPMALAKEYGILSANTSFVVIEERSESEKAKGQAELRQIPVMITKGWHGRDSIKFSCASPAAMFGGIGASAPMGGGIMDKLQSAVLDAFSSEFCLKEMAFSQTVCEEARDPRATPSPKKKSAKPPQEKLETPCRSSVDEGIPPHLLLMQEAQANGSFKLSQCLSDLCGKSVDDLRGWAAEITVDPGDEPYRESILATSLAIHWFATFAADEQPTWSLLVGKAKKWLKTCGFRAPGNRPLQEWIAEKLAAS